jgi:hypothetical protein
MRFSLALVATALSFSVGTHAWAKDAAGNWIANNDFLTIAGSTYFLHLEEN